MKILRRADNEKGAAMVEFALVLPVLLVLLIGMIEFSLILYDKAVITNASREAARAGIVYTMDRAPQNEAANRSEILSVVTDYCSDYLVSFEGGNPVPTIALPTGPCTASDNDLIVDVSYNYTFLIFPDFVTAFFGGSADSGITLTAQTTMRCE